MSAHSAQRVFFIYARAIFLTLVAASIFFAFVPDVYSQSAPGKAKECEVKFKGKVQISGKKGTKCVVNGDEGQCDGKGKCTITGHGKGDGKDKGGEIPKMPEMPKGGGDKGEEPAPPPPISTDMNPCQSGINDAFADMAARVSPNGKPCSGIPSSSIPIASTTAITTATSAVPRSRPRIVIMSRQPSFISGTTSTTWGGTFWDRAAMFVSQQVQLNSNQNSQWQQNVKNGTNSSTGGFVDPNNSFKGGFTSNGSMYNTFNNAGNSVNNVWNSFLNSWRGLF